MTCTWEPDFPESMVEAWNALTLDVRERALMLATSSLQTLTYNRVGTCPITIRPCPPGSPCGCGGWTPVLAADGQWYNCATCQRRCAPLSEVDLPGPVGYVDSLRVDGVEVDLAGFRLDEGHLLVWQGLGPSPIPTRQDLNRPDTGPNAVGTWSVTYSRSHAVAADGRLAVAYLAMEFAKAMTPKGKCSLPRGVTSVTRNGVSFSVEAGLWPGGLVGIDIVDQFILKWAPAGSPLRNATVFTPRQINRNRTTSAVPTRPTPPAPVAPSTDEPLIMGDGGVGLNP